MRKMINLLFACLTNAVLLFGQAPDISILKTKAPDTFRISFQTTKGEFIMEAYRDWSPVGVDRLYQLVTTGYYNNTILFRVEPDYVVQFGIAETHPVKLFWDKRKIKDDPVKQKHTKGTVAFARDFKNSRTTQLFIDMVDNPKLDTNIVEGVKGFTPIARIIKGMDVVASFYSKYKKRPAIVQDSLYKYGNGYFEKMFPGLDKIISARVIK